jgi:hypothetical protein
MARAPLTPTDILAAASEILTSSGYRRVPDDLAIEWRPVDSRLFEDAYGIVAIVVYGSWSELASSWLDAQARLIETMSRFVTTVDPKSWEGYLVLLTPAPVTRDRGVEADSIRYDTTHVRKLLATADELQTIADVRRVLLPLLPLDEVEVGSGQSALEALPDFVAHRGIDRDAVQVVVSAFLEQQPLMDRLHEHRTRSL